MSSFLRKVGKAAGVVASVAMFIPGGQGVAAAAGLVALASNVGAELTARRPTNERQGLQASFKIDPGGPIPYAIGRTAVGGTWLHRETYGTENHYETFFVALSHAGGAKTGVEAIEAMTADRVVVPYAGTQATGYFNNWMWQDAQPGASPEADALTHGIASPPFGAIPVEVPGWSRAHRTSGIAGVGWSLLFDTKARRYQNGEPTPMWVGKWAKAYDPRQDSTYPGGDGPQRWADPSDRAAHEAARATWTWTQTEGLLELKWVLGIWDAAPGQPFKRVMGIGAPIDLVDVAAFVEAANVQEANGWTIGGELNSAMDKWEALKLMAEAGGTEPVPNGARWSTIIKRPRVSLATITRDDLAGGAISVPNSRPRRERLNGWRPRFRSEAHGWEMVPTNLVQIGSALAEDGAPRTGSGDFALVQDATQAAQLAAYIVFDGRERTPIAITLKPKWAAYRVGDCLTVDLPEYGLIAQPCVIRAREIDPIAAVVTLTFATETASKHAAALGVIGTVVEVPQTPDPQAGVPPPAAGDWSAEVGDEPGSIKLSGAVSNTSASQVQFSYRTADGEWIGAGSDDAAITGKMITGLASGTTYFAGVQYVVRGEVSDRRQLGPVTTAEAEEPARGAYRVTSLNPQYPVESDDTSITLIAATAVINDGRTIEMPAGTIGGLQPATSYAVFFNLTTQVHEVEAYPASTRLASPDYVFVLWQSTLNSDGTAPEGDTPPPGYGGGGSNPNVVAQ